MFHVYYNPCIGKAIAALPTSHLTPLDGVTAHSCTIISALLGVPYMNQELTRNTYHINNLGHLTSTQPSLDPIQKSLPTRIPVPLLGKLLPTQRMHAFPERGGGERRVECV